MIEIAGRGDIVERVESITLENFRGWRKQQTVDLSANILLITAANGRGKSSLIEALSIVLNGVTIHHETENRSLKEKAQASTIILETSIGSLKTGDDKSWPHLPEGGDLLSSSVRRRSTVFLQDRLDEQFEADGRETLEAEGRGTLLDFLAQAPAWLVAYESALEKWREIWSAERARSDQARSSVAEIENARRRRETASETFLADLSRLNAPSAPPGGSAWERVQAIVLQNCREVSGRSVDIDDPNTWKESIEKWLWADYQTSEQNPRESADVIARRDKAVADLTAHEHTWPNLQQLAGWWNSASDPGAPGLANALEMVSILAEPAHDWADTDRLSNLLADLPANSSTDVPSLEEVCRGLPEELRKVDKARAERYRKALADWDTFWTAKREEREALEKKLREAEEAADALKTAVKPTAAQKSPDDLVKAIEHLKTLERNAENEAAGARSMRRVRPLLAVIKRQQAFLRDLQESKLPEEIKREVNASIEAVVQHFIIAGLETGKRIDLEPSGTLLRPMLADGRRLDAHCSTGQRAQLALAFLLATNALIQRWLPHRVLLLDDVSTALDLTNLAAECALLRKFAYTTNPHRKRQIVIASHHDQLTHRLFDLLIPPEGFTMREIRLVDWTLEEGPTVEPAMIKPTRAATDDTRRELAERLGAIFRDRRPRSPMP